MLNSKEADLKFLGGNGRIRVSGQDSSIIRKGGYGRVWGGCYVSSVEEVKQRAKDTTLGYSGVNVEEDYV
jgi:hypothetical protein